MNIPEQMNTLMHNDTKTPQMNPLNDLLLATRNLITYASQANRQLARPSWLESAINEANRAVTAMWADLEESGDIPTEEGQ